MFKDRDITISVLRGNIHNTNRFSEFQAVAHFRARVEISDGQFSTPDQSSDDYHSKICKFDTLTFDQLGGIVRLPGKQNNKKARHYTNVVSVDVTQVKKRDLSSMMLMDEDSFDFPDDVFEKDLDMEFLKLPAKA